MSERTNRYRYELVVAPEAERQALFYKRLANDIIFESPQLQQMEHKARKVLFDLWESCWRNYVEPGPRVVRILPPAVGDLVDAAPRAGRPRPGRSATGWPASPTGRSSGPTAGSSIPEFGSIRDLS